MASPTWYIDGDKLRIYEVPIDPTFTTDGEGYRIYNTNNVVANMALVVDVQADLWSRWVDWHMLNKWSYLAFSRSGGKFRGYDQHGDEEYQSVDFTLLTTNGWQIVLANFPHKITIYGNLFSESGHMFDHDRLTSIPSPMPVIMGAADLLTYRVSIGSGLSPEQAEELAWLKRRLEGNEVRAPGRLTVTDKDTAEVLVDKDVDGSAQTTTITVTDH